MRVRDTMTHRVVSVRPEDTLSLAAQAMVWAGIRHLPVIERGALVGVLSERDVLRHRATSLELDPLRSRVRQAMVTAVEVADPEEELGAAAQRMMAKRIGCLPVVEHGAVIGMLTTTDVLGEQVRSTMRSERRRGPAARDLMTTGMISARPEERLSEAVGRMSEAGVRHLPVVDAAGKLVGILSDRDIGLGELSAVPDGDWIEQQSRLLRVETLMTTDVLTLAPEAPLGDIIAAFAHWRLGALPVVDEEGRLLGIVSYVDVLKSLAARATGDEARPQP